MMRTGAIDLQADTSDIDQFPRWRGGGLLSEDLRGEDQRHYCNSNFLLHGFVSLRNELALAGLLTNSAGNSAGHTSSNTTGNSSRNSSRNAATNTASHAARWS